jgi:putative ABC transport system substrate-binding protein
MKKIWRKIVLLMVAAALLAAPLAGLAQAPAAVTRIGLVHVGNDHVPSSYDAMREGMRALGYEEGRNIAYDFRNVPDYAAALEATRSFAREPVAMIIAFDQEAANAAQKATSTIPIVVLHMDNPVAAGFAKSLSHPGGNMTGFAGRATLPAKELEILREIAPRLSKVLLLYDSTDSASLGWRADARKAAKTLRITLVERDTPDLESLKAVFEKVRAGDAEALVFASNTVRHLHSKVALTLATARKIALVSARNDMVAAGALFSFSYDFPKVGRAAASRYVDRILKGTKPADLPIEEVSEYELVVNRGTAKRHGWAISQTVLVRASKIIE